jgi:hypothetical protein
VQRPHGIIEIGYVVLDLAQAADYFQATLGAGPFRIFENVDMTRAEFMGRPTEPQLDIAMARAGDVVIELVKQKNAALSPFPAPRDGARFVLNHFSAFADDFDAQLRRHLQRGTGVVFTAQLPSATAGATARIAYLDTRSELGAYLELMERTPVLWDLYRGLLDDG